MMMLAGLGAEDSSAAESFFESLKTDTNHKGRWELNCWATYMGVKNGVLATKIERLLEQPLSPSRKKVWEDNLAAALNNKVQFRRVRDFAVAAQNEIDGLAAWDTAGYKVCPEKPPRPSGMGVLPALLAPVAIKIALWAVGGAVVYLVLDGINELVANLAGSERIKDVEARVEAITECIESQIGAGVPQTDAASRCEKIGERQTTLFSPLNIALVAGGVYVYLRWKEGKK